MEVSSTRKRSLFSKLSSGVGVGVAGGVGEGESEDSEEGVEGVEKEEVDVGVVVVVSTVRVTVLLDSAPSWLLLPDESENLLLSTWITPLVVLSVSGVKVAV